MLLSLLSGGATRFLVLCLIRISGLLVRCLQWIRVGLPSLSKSCGYGRCMTSTCQRSYRALRDAIAGGDVSAVWEAWSQAEECSLDEAFCASGGPVPVKRLFVQGREVLSGLKWLALVGPK